MSLPALQVRCPRCKGVNLVSPQLAGSTQACAVCHTPFIVPSFVTPSTQPAYSQQQPAYSQQPPAGPLPPHLRALAQQPPAAPPPVAAKPAEEELRKPSRWIGLTMRLSLLAIAASLIVAVVLVPKAVDLLKTQSERKQAEQPPPEMVEIVDWRPGDKGPIHWIDASRSTGMRTGMQVRVTRCEFGPVMARDNLNQPLIAGPGEFLQIHLKITNKQKAKARYISWYSNTFRDGSEQVAAKLSDDTGREFPPQRFSGVKMIESHVDYLTLEPGESTNDVLIFALPAAKAAGESELRLQLPAAAVARTGWFNFKLPPDLWER